MQDYNIDDPINNLPIYTADNWGMSEGEFWRELLMERWEERKYIGILSEEETDSSHLWRMPDWAINILDVIKNEPYTSYIVPNWMDAVISVCLGEVDNLQEINWGQATDGWHYSIFDNILACIPDDRLAVAILQCAIKEAEADYSIDSPSDKNAFVTYCQSQIKYIQSRDMFDLATILQADRARLDDVEKRLVKVENKLASMTTQMPTEFASMTTQIPAELSSDDAQAILKRAVDAGLCEQEQGGSYKWLKSIQMLAYFAVRASDYLELTNRLYNGNYVTQWQPFAVLFGVEAKKLSRAKQDYQKGSNGKPKGYEAIDALFDKA